MTSYKVITRGNPLEVWGVGFHDEIGKAEAQRRIVEGYWHRYMYDADKNKTLEVVEDKKWTERL